MPSPYARLRRARPLLGTLVEITAHGDAAHLPEAVDRAFAAIGRVHALMSGHDPCSDVSRLNRAGHAGPVAVDPHTWTVLARAQRISAASDGAFDVTVAPRLVQWGYLPSPAQPLPAVVPGGYRSIELLPGHRVRCHAPVLVDLGGIAKGYAVDVACAALERDGVTDYVVNAGGDLRVGAAPTPVHVRHPGRPDAVLALGTINNAAIATSGRYFAAKRTNEGIVHPIVAPATARPARHGASISIRAADCMTADALTKVVAVLGTAAAAVLEHFGAEAVLIRRSGAWRSLPERRRSAGRRIGDMLAADAVV